MTSGALNRMWVCHELRSILDHAKLYVPHDEDETATVINPFEGVMEQADQLGEQEQAWLTHYSQSTATDQRSVTVNVEKETSMRQHSAKIESGRKQEKERVFSQQESSEDANSWRSQ